MKIRKCIIILALLVFSLLQYASIAESGQDPVQAAHNEYTIANEAYSS